MIRTFGLRLLAALPVLWGVVTLVFLLLHMVPGDPVDLMLGESAQAAQKDDLRKKLHLDEPIGLQYARFVKGAVTLDLGISIATGEPVLDRIAEKFPATIYLAMTALFFSLLFSIPAGMISAARRGGPFDHALMTFSLFGLAVPVFWLGPVLILIFSFSLKWFPASGAEEASSVILPALTLGLGMAALLSRMTRNSVAETLQDDYIRTAKAKGLSARTIFFRHALKGSLLPIVTVLGLQAGALLSGAVITERVFSWPGIGTELIRGIEKRDYPVVQGCVLVIAVSYVLVNLLTDLAYGWIDPRIRQGEQPE